MHEDEDDVELLYPPPTLQELLSIGRLQTLKQLTLDIEPRVLWVDFIDLFQIVIETSPSVRKLSVEPKELVELEDHPPIDELAEQLVGVLVKFEEVDFGKDGFLYHRRNATVATAILRRITEVASSEEDSKLRVLSMPGFEPSPSPFPRPGTVLGASLAEARKLLTVNLIRPRQISVDF